MSNYKKFKGETISNYIQEYIPLINVDSPTFVKLPADKKDNRLKDIEREIIQYWELINPIIREYIKMIVDYLNDFGEGTEGLESLRRSLDLELQNSSELSNENRKLKAQVSDMILDKKTLTEKLDDLIKEKPTISKEEFESLKLLTSSKFDVSTGDFENLLSKAVQNVRESDAMKKAREEKEKMQEELESEKARFEKVQQEVGETFQNKLMEYQTRLDELEEELEQYNKK